MNCGHFHGKVLPLRTFETAWMYAQTSILVAAVELDVFTHLAQGRQTLPSLAKGCGASRRGLRVLLNALVAQEFLRKSGSRYWLQAEAARYLVRGQSDYLGEYVIRLRAPWNEWKHLAGVVRTGRPRRAINRVDLGKRFFPKLAQALFPGNFLTAKEVAPRIAPGPGNRNWKILDVACGAAPWSMAFAIRDPSVRVVALDLPEVLKVTRRFAVRHEVRRQYEFLAGDWNGLDFGPNRYDLVVLGHILHSEGVRRSRTLVRRCYRSLKKGGRLLIVEINPDDQRASPRFPLVFAVNMLMFTEQGDTYTFGEIRSWCQAAGFHRITRLASPSVSPLILARK
jgi:ubiquinone/menaquinone biosynthesis C-methylase UbiE